MSARATLTRPANEPVARPVSHPRDASEREADGVADRVAQGESVGGWLFTTTRGSAPSPVSRQASASTPGAKNEKPDVEGASTRALRWSYADILDEHRAGDNLRKSADGWKRGQIAPPSVKTALNEPGRPLPQAVAEALGPRTAGRVRVHTDVRAETAAATLDASAFAVGHDIFFARGHYAPYAEDGFRLLSHEIRHVQQASDRVTPELPTMVEEADLESASDSKSVSADPRALGSMQRSRYTAPFKWALKRLGKNTKKLIKEHIAAHTRRIATKPIHSVFKNPRQVRQLITSTIREAIEVVGSKANKAVTGAIEEGSLRIFQQVRGQGKLRFVIQKTFGKAIGTNGETVLRIVIDQSGKLVTAFPERLAVLGVTAAGFAAFTERTADAAEHVQASVAREAALKQAALAPADESWWEWVPIIGDVWGGSLNSGESQMLEADRERSRREQFIKVTVAEIIRFVQEDRQQSLGQAEAAEIEEYVRMVLVSGIDAELDDDEIPQE